MTEASTFFEERQPAAVLKHGILRRYLHPFASKTGKFAPDQRVVYLDGYAGPGTYSDGTPGSPALAEETAVKVASFRRLECIFVEKDQGMYLKLAEMLKPYDNWNAHHGVLDEKLDEVLGEVGQAPLFVFLDPFGLTIPFDDFVDKLLRRPQTTGAITEVLLNFSTRGLERNSGHLTSDKDYPAKQALVDRTDARLGGDWWHGIWRENPPERNDLILSQYVERLRSSAGGGWGRWTIPVANHVDGDPMYHLVFFTQHADGLWTFSQALSSALEEFHDFCYRDRLDLDPLPEREKRWVEVIRTNIEHLLGNGSFVVQKRLGDICGEALGYAREKHIRKAIKSLYKDGKTLTPGIGDIQHMVVVPS